MYAQNGSLVPMDTSQIDVSAVPMSLLRIEKKSKEDRRCLSSVFSAKGKQPTPHGYMIEWAGQNLGKYTLEEELGRGSMGIVYRGKHVALGRVVAVKIFARSGEQDSSSVARFMREAQVIAGLNHPTIVQVYDAGQHQDVLYFVMEYVLGPTIGSLLRLDGSLPHYLAVEYIAQVAEALDAAYTEWKVIHRNLTPENLMLDRWGRIKVMDFDLASVYDQQLAGETLIGDISYASPELLCGQPLDHRSDLYSLGAILYEMITGSRPYSGHTSQELIQAKASGWVIPPTTFVPDLSPALEHLIVTALACNRDDRFATGTQMARELRALHMHAPTAEPARSSPEMKRVCPVSCFYPHVHRCSARTLP